LLLFLRSITKTISLALNTEEYGSFAGTAGFPPTLVGYFY
jgi:hypothetical protein